MYMKHVTTHTAQVNHFPVTWYKQTCHLQLVVKHMFLQSTVLGTQRHVLIKHVFPKIFKKIPFLYSTGLLVTIYFLV